MTSAELAQSLGGTSLNSQSSKTIQPSSSSSENAQSVGGVPLGSNQQPTTNTNGPLGGISNFLGTTGLGQGIGQTIANAEGAQRGDLEQLNKAIDLQSKILGQIKQYQTEGRDTSHLENALNYVTQTINSASGQATELGTGGLTNKQVIGSAVQTLGNVVGAGIGSEAPSVAGRIGSIAAQSGGVGALQAGARAYGQGGNVGDIVKSAAIGGGVGAALGGVTQGIGEALTHAQPIANKLLSYSSGTPEEAFSLLNERPAVSKNIGISPQQTLSDTQGIIRGFRKQLTDGWNVATDGIAQEFSGQRVGLPTKLQNLLESVDEKYGIASMPQNTSNMSALELINLTKDVNELARKPAFVMSPEGVSIQKLSDQLRDIGIKNFGGEGGSYARLYKNYSTEKTVFDAANSIFQAYKTGKPITQATALSRLQKVFEDNKVPYIDALKQLESATGKDVLSKVAALQFNKVLPENAFGTDLFAKTLKLLALPLTSPRGAAFFSQAAGKLAGAAKAIAPVVSGVRNIAVPNTASVASVNQSRQ